jgi:hypothetical protein
MKCPEHQAKYEKITMDYEQFGAILKDVEGLCCPVGGETLFRLEQAERIRESHR